jgi:hypothetical protein
VEAAKRRFHKLKEDYINKKSLDALIMDNNESGPTNNKSKKDILIENEHAAWEQNFQLENAKRAALDIEHVGGEVMRSMHGQTNQLKNIKGRVIQLDENIDQGDYYINNMYSTQRKKKLAIIAFGIIFAIIFLVVMIFKFMN